MNLAGIEHHADRLLLLDQGRVIESGPARQIATAPATDYGKRLMAATPAIVRTLGRIAGHWRNHPRNGKGDGHFSQARLATRAD